MNLRSIPLLVLPFVLAACADTPPPQASSPSEVQSISGTTPPTPKEAPPAGPRKLGYKDFMDLDGVRLGATLGDVENAWGPASNRSTDLLRYEDGPSVKTRITGDDKSMMFDFGPWAKAWVAKHPKSPIAAIFGKSCDEAAKALEFAETIAGYTTCKHYEHEAMIDITMMCSSGTVSTVAVVWYQFPRTPYNRPLPLDECTESGTP